MTVPVNQLPRALNELRAMAITAIKKKDAKYAIQLLEAQKSVIKKVEKVVEEQKKEKIPLKWVNSRY